jgi:hypothetical protein
VIGLIAAAWMMIGMAAEAPDAASPSESALSAASTFSTADELFRAIELHYPDEYRRLIDVPGRDAVGAAAAKGSPTRPMAGFFQRRAAGLRNAPPDLLIRLNAMQLALIRRLAREDVALCADFATTAFAGRLDLPDAYQRDASSLGALIVEASKLGEGRAGDGRTDALAENDAFTWYSQLLREEPSTEFNVAATGGGEDAQGDELECRVGLASLGALARLPPEQAANVGASLLADMLAEPGRD